MAAENACDHAFHLARTTPRRPRRLSRLDRIVEAAVIDPAVAVLAAGQDIGEAVVPADVLGLIAVARVNRLREGLVEADDADDDLRLARRSRPSRLAPKSGLDVVDRMASPSRSARRAACAAALDRAYRESAASRCLPRSSHRAASISVDLRLEDAVARGDWRRGTSGWARRHGRSRRRRSAEHHPRRRPREAREDRPVASAKPVMPSSTSSVTRKLV